MLVNCSPDRKREGSPFHGSWPPLVSVPITLTGCLVRAVGALAPGEGGNWGRPRKPEDCPFL